MVQVGPWFKANLTAQQNATSGMTLGFSNVQMNVSRFGVSFLNNTITDLQKFTKPLQTLADALEKPLLPGWGFTMTGLMQQLGYGQAASVAKTFADTIEAINSLSPTLTSNDAWVNLGSFTTQVQGSSQLVTVGSVATSATNLASQLSSSLSNTLAQLNHIPGLQVALNDPNQLFKLLTGEKATLFSYTLRVPSVISVSVQQQLAAIPVSPVTLTEFDIYANLAMNLSGSATFGFDTTGFQSGNLANGFFVQSAHLTASLTAGLSGLLNEADLAGYKITGAVTGSVTASLKGPDSSGKVYAQQLSNGGIVFSAPSWSFGITSEALGPQQMLSLAIQQYGPYLKNLVGYDSQLAANVLHGKGVSPTQIVEALGTIYGIPPDKTALILKKAGATAEDIAGALKGAFNETDKQVAAALNQAGEDATAIASALGHVFRDTDQVAASVLNYAGVGATSIASALHSVYGDADRAAYWMNQAG